MDKNKKVKGHSRGSNNSNVKNTSRKEDASHHTQPGDHGPVLEDPILKDDGVSLSSSNPDDAVGIVDETIKHRSGKNILSREQPKMNSSNNNAEMQKSSGKGRSVRKATTNDHSCPGFDDLDSKKKGRVKSQPRETKDSSNGNRLKTRREDKPFTVKERIQSIEVYSRPAPRTRPPQYDDGDEKEEENHTIEETEKKVEEEEEFHEEVAEEEEEYPRKISIRDEQVHDVVTENGGPKSDDIIMLTLQRPISEEEISHDASSNPKDWSAKAVKELREQMIFDSSSDDSDAENGIDSSGSNIDTEITVASDAPEHRLQTPKGVSYLYHDPEAALRLSEKPKKTSSLKNSVKKKTDNFLVDGKVILDKVMRKKEPSVLAQETPWLVNEKNAPRVDILAKYKFFTSARLRHKARNMIGATGSRHMNQKRRSSLAAGTTLPLTLVSNLEQLSESDESRMANVPRRRVVDTSDLRTCAILQSRLKELKTYPE